MKEKIGLLGVPFKFGQPLDGVDLGPKALRYAGLVKRLLNSGFDVTDFGDLILDNLKEDFSNSKLKNIASVVRTCSELSLKIENIVRDGYFPLVLGGDHSIAIGTIAGIAKHVSPLGVIWCDAHGDLNTDATTPSGNIHGMALSSCLGYGHSSLTNILDFSPKVSSENVVLIGVRDLDKGEREFIKSLKIKVFDMFDIDRLGISNVIQEALEIVTKGTKGVHLSFDLDFLDPKVACGVGTPVLGGISYREALCALNMLGSVVTSAEFVEVNPLLDKCNETSKVAVDMILSLFRGF